MPLKGILSRFTAFTNIFKGIIYKRPDNKKRRNTRGSGAGQTAAGSWEVGNGVVRWSKTEKTVSSKVKTTNSVNDS